MKNGSGNILISIYPILENNSIQHLNICIIGFGTYGCYLYNKIREKYGNDINVTVIEIGNGKIKSEEEIGIESISTKSSASHFGRYFGLGGTSAKWGGQILFFDDRDNNERTELWSKIVSINKKYKGIVLSKLIGNQSNEVVKEEETSIKTGVWLKYGKRNMFKHIHTKAISETKIYKNCRVIDLVIENSSVKKIVCKGDDNKSFELEADIFYLTAGAIESCRILLNNETLTSEPRIEFGKNYGDHISVELFHVKGAPKVLGTDFTYKFQKGNLITKRIIVYTKENRTGYLHFIFNKNVKIFVAIKSLLFGRGKFAPALLEVFKGIPFLVCLGFKYLFRGKLHIDETWSLQLDLEQQFPNNNYLSLNSKTKDSFGEKAISVNWDISKSDLDSIEEIRNFARELFKKEGINFEEVIHDDLNEKIEDIYHPVGFLRMGSDETAPVDLQYKVRGTNNLYHFSTALFPSAKSINPTAAGFCLIEDHVENYLGNIISNFPVNIKKNTLIADRN